MARTLGGHTAEAERAYRWLAATQAPDDYQLERNFTIQGIGTADGALGHFGTGKPPA